MKEIIKKFLALFSLKVLKINTYESLIKENNFLKEKVRVNQSQESIFNELKKSNSAKSVNKIANDNRFNIALINANIYTSKNKKIFSDVIETAAGNTGNSYIGEYLYRGFNKYNNVSNLQNNIFFDPIPETKNLQNKDFIIFSFQDLLKDSLSYFGQVDPFIEWKKILKKTTALPIVIGIGINNPDGENLPVSPLASLIDLLKLIDEMGGFICTRCNRTTYFLNKYGINNVMATGCPSLFAYESDPRKKIKDITPEMISNSLVGINGVFWSKHLNQSKLLPVLQDETGFLRLITDEQSLAFTDISYNLDMSKGYTKMILDSIKAKTISIHGTVEHASSFYKKMLFSIGTRVHGAIASLNGGTPAIVTNGDLRAKSMCEFFKIPHKPEFGFANIQNKFGEDISLEKLCNFLKDHNWDESVKTRQIRANLFKSLLEMYSLKFDVLEKLDINEKNLAEYRLSEINLDNSSASKYLINKLKEF